MADNEKAIEKIVLTRLLRLNATIMGLVTGSVIGFGIFAATLWLVIKGGYVVGPNLSLLGQFYPGYTVTFVGSFIGLGYGFVTGFVIGYFIATVYNWLAAWRESRHPDRS